MTVQVKTATANDPESVVACVERLSESTEQHKKGRVRSVPHKFGQRVSWVEHPCNKAISRELIPATK